MGTMDSKESIRSSKESGSVLGGKPHNIRCSHYCVGLTIKSLLSSAIRMESGHGILHINPDGK